MNTKSTDGDWESAPLPAIALTWVEEASKAGPYLRLASHDTSAKGVSHVEIRNSDAIWGYGEGKDGSSAFAEALRDLEREIYKESLGFKMKRWMDADPLHYVKEVSDPNSMCNFTLRVSDGVCSATGHGDTTDEAFKDGLEKLKSQYLAKR